MANSTNVNCTALIYRSSFKSYIGEINATTHGKRDLIEACKPQICNALWGSGNPDISGIGIAVGYIMGNVFGLLLTAIFILSTKTKLFSPSILRFTKGRVLASMADVYHDSATFLTFSIQIASTVVLARADLGLSANGLGALTQQITWTASLLTLLPLMYCTFVPGLCHVPERSTEERTSFEEKDAEKRREEFKRDYLRLYLFILCWILSLYPFLSSMLETFGPSKIGDGQGAVISDVDWEKLENVCFDGVRGINLAEYKLYRAFWIAGWIFVSFFAIYVLIELGVKSNHENSRLAHFFETNSLLPSTRKTYGPTSEQNIKLPLVLVTVLATLAAAGLTSFFRFQAYQAQISGSAGNADTDMQWTFGQVVGLTVFAPVLVEAWYGWRSRGDE